MISGNTPNGVDESVIIDLINKNNQLSTVLEHSPLLVYMKDKNLNYITGSKYAKDFVENGIDRYTNGNVQLDMNSVKELTEEEDSYVLNTKQTLIKEKTAYDFNKEPHWYKVCKAPILDSNGDVNGLVTITRNLDSEKQVEFQKEFFVATVAHDIKNPIAGQINILKLLKNGTFGNLNNEQTEIVDTMLESAVYLNDMLKSLLITYTADNGYLKLEKTNIDFKPFIHKCVKESSIAAKEKSINIKFVMPDEDINLIVDEMQIRRVISNLLTNSLDHAFANTDIIIKVTNKDDKVILSIENQSEVIPEEVKLHMFEKYNTNSTISAQRGFGLGLYLSKKIITAHHGEIFFEAEDNRNLFGFVLPKNINK